jgi:hypothetical protein
VPFVIFSSAGDVTFVMHSPCLLIPLIVLTNGAAAWIAFTAPVIIVHR